jgi:hypothetical protein
VIGGSNMECATAAADQEARRCGPRQPRSRTGERRSIKTQLASTSLGLPVPPGAGDQRRLRRAPHRLVLAEAAMALVRQRDQGHRARQADKPTDSRSWPTVGVATAISIRARLPTPARRMDDATRGGARCCAIAAADPGAGHRPGAAANRSRSAYAAGLPWCRPRAASKAMVSASDLQGTGDA